MKLSNSYIGLPEEFYQLIAPTPVKSPTMLAFNNSLAEELGIKLKEQEKIDYFSGNTLPLKSVPIALNYAGHQFGNFVHELGDGRAVLLGEVRSKNTNYDLQLKGSGITQFSRQGDGRSALGPVIREYILSEAMHCLNIPTTRALAAMATGEHVARDTFEPGGILTRVAKSHLRVGTFEYFASRQQWEDVKLLADYSIQRHFPEIRESNNHYLELLKQVASHQSILISKWMSVGFVHGVMNTDNFTISGETIDYGPCAFLDEYHPGKVFSSIDQDGRYAFGNQPSIASWNLASLAGCLIAFIDKDSDKANELATEVLDNFSIETNQRILDLMCEKISLDGSVKENQNLLRQLLKIMMESGSDYTITFRSLSEVLLDQPGKFLDQFKNKDEIGSWLNDWKKALATDEKDLQLIVDQMKSVNPMYIPRNHQVQLVIDAAYNNDFSKMAEMIEVIRRPFEEIDKNSSYAEPPLEEQRIKRTFCGT
ncbi:YdiU family protein [Gammaproteobacteria bacterium]|nr:YdiU family protein [Gammaproteobacteria bacterium]